LYFCANDRLMNLPSNSDQFYTNLKEKLESSDVWPNTYLYKFIYKTKDNQLESLKAIFQELRPEYRVVESGKGTYTSVSITLIMESPNAIIEKYKEVGAKVTGVISL
jgi:putative lipoic acid-binding regulatory protein